MLNAVLCSIGVVACGVVAYVVHQRRSPKIHARLKCRCGAVQGCIDTIVSDTDPFVCYCDSCQRYAAWVASTNKSAKSCLTESGGTRGVQMRKNAVTITSGSDKIVVSKLSPKTDTLRIYSTCCGTAMFNVGQGFPLVGVVTDFIDEIEKFDAAGPPLHAFVGKATKSIPAHDGKEISGFTISLVARVIFNVVRYWPARHSFPFDLSVEPLLIPTSK